MGFGYVEVKVYCEGQNKSAEREMFKKQSDKDGYYPLCFRCIVYTESIRDQELPLFTLHGLSNLLCIIKLWRYARFNVHYLRAFLGEDLKQ